MMDAHRFDGVTARHRTHWSGKFYFLEIGKVLHIRVNVSVRGCRARGKNIRPDNRA